MKSIIDLIYPKNIYCICCGAIIDNKSKYSICDKCIRKIHWIEDKFCEKCGRIIERDYVDTRCKDCKSKAHQFNQGYVCTKYGLYERVLMMDYKYGDKAYIGKILAEIMAERIAVETLEVDLIIPVPIHASRKKKRGYNQAEILSKEIGRKLGKRNLNTAVIRTKKTKPMKSLNVNEREENVMKAFQIRGRYREDLIGKKVLLIDDIYTTGSTANSLSRLLVEEGVKEVNVLTFAAGKNQ